MTIRHFYSLSFLTLLFSVVACASSNECVYTLYVQTGWIIKAGTNSKISIALGDSIGNSVWIPNLKDWGLMGHKHDYFELSNLDIFAGRGPCIGSPICRLNVTSDGSGSHHGWLCEYIEVTFNGPHMGCSTSIFHINQWLATDVPPFQLSAVLDECLKESQRKSEPYVESKISHKRNRF